MSKDSSNKTALRIAIIPAFMLAMAFAAVPFYGWFCRVTGFGRGTQVRAGAGDDSLDGQATDAFIDRRIDDVMKFEKVKAQVNANPLLKPFTGPLGKILSGVRAPAGSVPDDLPGVWKDPQ